MAKTKTVPQKKFETLDDFVKGQNNFYAHFLGDNPFAQSRINKPHFKRFQEQHPELEKKLTEAVVEARNTGKRLPYEDLWEAYQHMSEMVYEDDEGVKKYSTPDQYLTS